MLDGQYANVYYNNSLAGTHIVNPINGIRFSDNKIWGSYIVGNRLGIRVFCMTCSGGEDVFWVNSSTCKNDDGYLEPVSICKNLIGDYYIYNTGWH